MINETIIKTLAWRYAVKKFSDKKISKTDLKTILQSIQLMPTSLGLQFFKVIVIENEELKRELKIASYNQNQIDSCSHLLVFCIPNEVTTEMIDATMEERKVIQKLEEQDVENLKKMAKKWINSFSETEVIHWLTNQCYLAIGNAVTVSSLLEIDTCPMEGFNRQLYDEILQLQNRNLTSVIALAIGYRSEDDVYINQPKYRKSQEILFDIF